MASNAKTKARKLTTAPAPAPTAAPAPAHTSPAAVGTLAPSPLALALAAGRAAGNGTYTPPVRTQYAPGARPVGGLLAAHNYTVAPQWLTACPARPGTYRAQFWPAMQQGSGGTLATPASQHPIVTWAYALQAAAAGHIAITCASTGRRVVPGAGGKGYTYAAD